MIFSFNIKIKTHWICLDLSKLTYETCNNNHEKKSKAKSPSKSSLKN